MTKPLLFTLGTVAAASALAAVVVQGAYGKGRAETSDGRNGRFDFEVAKRIDGPAAPTFSGRFRFEQVANARGPFVLIEMGKPAGLGLAINNPTVCEFVGPGSLTRIVENRRVTYRGRVDVRVQNRRTPERPRLDPDTFRVRFLAENGLTFAFEGLVREGDLVVFSR